MNDEESANPPAQQVVAALIENSRGEYLIAQRPQGKAHAGLWEFPGGKIESGESAFQALQRELREELAIDVSAAVRVMTSVIPAGPRALHLQAWRVLAWSGTPTALEAPAINWRLPAQLSTVAMPEADHPIVAALCLPSRYFFTPDAATCSGVELLAAIERAVSRGADLVRLRCDDPDFRLPPALIRLCERAACHHGAGFMVDLADWEHCRDPGSGVHLRARDLHSADFPSHAPKSGRIIASCHDARELLRADDQGAHAVVLSPVMPTHSHPDHEPLGWPGFRALHAKTRLPAYALGGLAPTALDDTLAHGACGVAGISGFLNSR